MAGRPLIISSAFPPNRGGIQRYIHDLYVNLPGEPYRVLTFDAPGDAEFDRACRLAVTRVRIPRSVRGMREVRLFLAALSMMRRESAPHIHYGSVRPEGRMAWLLKKVTGRDYLVFAHGKEISDLNSAKSGSLRFKSLFNARTVIANSGFTMQRLLDLGIPPDRVAVVSPAVDTERFRPEPKNRQLVEQLGLEGRRVILSVGRVIERKGFDTVIKALPKIAAEVPEVCYVIAGVGSYLPDVRKLADSLGVQDRVRYAGDVEDDLLPAYYSLADVFAMISRTLPGGDCEGFGIVFIEAGACAKPVVGGLSGGVSDAVPDGGTGLLVDPTDAAQVAEATVRILKDDELASQMGLAGRERAIAEFDTRRQGRRLREVIDQRFG